MKKISFAICAMLMLCDNSSALGRRAFKITSNSGSNIERTTQVRSVESGLTNTSNAGKIRVNVFTTNTAPHIKLVQIPSREQLIFNDFCYTKHLNMNCGTTINGVKYPGPLKVDYDMSVQQLIDALQTCVGPNVTVEHSEDWLNDDYDMMENEIIDELRQILDEFENETRQPSIKLPDEFITIMRELHK